MENIKATGPKSYKYRWVVDTVISADYKKKIVFKIFKQN